MDILAINGPYGHGQRHCQHDCYGYPVKTYQKNYSSVFDSTQKYFLFKSYSCLKFFLSNLHSENASFPPNLSPPEILGLERKVLEMACYHEQNWRVAELIYEGFA